MSGVRIPQDLNGEDQFVLGLSVPRLAALLLGLLAAYTILHLSLPGPIQLAGAAIAAAIGALVAWVRPEGRSLIHWLIAAIEFKFSREREPSEPIASRRRIEDQPVRKRTITIAEAPRHLQVIPRASAAPVVTNQSLLSSSSDSGDDDVIELPESPAAILVESRDPDEGENNASAPVYLGGPQVITFFSTKGGTGRTTLATEVASLLALKGRYRLNASGGAQRLRVALVDFDLASANVSARLGLAQPTMLDYLCDSGVPSPDPREFLVQHRPTNLDVLLGPSKCLAGDRAELMGVAQAAHILSSLKDAYQFLILDMAASLGDLETYLLEAASRIYCVVTPTAGSVQSLYRGVEALRRLGLGNKLHYVANKMRDGVSLSEALGDLNGVLAATIPYDPVFDSAENRHEPVVLGHGGVASLALTELASSIYPALQHPFTRAQGARTGGWFGRRRRAG